MCIQTTPHSQGTPGSYTYDHGLYESSLELFTIYEMLCPLSKDDLDKDITWTYFIEDLILTISNKLILNLHYILNIISNIDIFSL